MAAPPNRRLPRSDSQRFPASRPPPQPGGRMPAAIVQTMAGVLRFGASSSVSPASSGSRGSCRNGSDRGSGRSPDWLKTKNPDAPAVKRNPRRFGAANPRPLFHWKRRPLPPLAVLAGLRLRRLCPCSLLPSASIETKAPSPWRGRRGERRSRPVDGNNRRLAYWGA